jgi:16S rRNA (cytidine1402-2'-O)-methyltransferase
VQRAATDVDMARGEIVLLIAGAPADEQHGDRELLARALPLLLKELPPARAASIAAKLSGCERELAYQQAVQLANRGKPR